MTADIESAAASLAGGGVVLHATEGVWGFACDPFCAAAIDKIFTLKNRPASKGLVLIGAAASVFETQLAAVDATHAAEVRASWPGHHTWILPDTSFPDEVRGGRETIACRVPGHAQARALCAAFGGALISTSANLSGCPPITEGETARRDFGALVDYFLAGEVGSAGRASTIHDLDGKILR